MAFIPVGRKPIVFIDTETTGLDPHTHEIIEISILREQRKGPPDVWSSKIRPMRLEVATPIALKINGYADHPEQWDDAPTFPEIAADIFQRLDGCVVGGHNVGFDLDFLAAAYQRAGLDVRLPYHKIDTVTLAYEHLVPSGLESLSLDSIRDFLGMSKAGAHTAQQDAIDSWKVFRRLTRATRPRRLCWRVTKYPLHRTTG